MINITKDIWKLTESDINLHLDKLVEDDPYYLVECMCEDAIMPYSWGLRSSIRFAIYY